MIEQLRTSGFEPDWTRVQTRQDFLAEIYKQPDLILADYNLPQFDALRALKMVQERDLDVPFIVVTGTLEEAAMECVKYSTAQ